jgi:ribonuclease BN (tRNA processing enzyme)
MRIVLLGTGFAVPSQKRVQSGVLIGTEGNLILLDCGSGVMGNLAKAGYDTTDITQIFFTHAHLDHNIDFFPILKARILLGKAEMKAYGPVGTERWIKGLFEAYPYLEGRLDLKVCELKDGDVVDIGNDKVTCASTCHVDNSIGYRIDSDSSVVCSGDTEPCAGVKTLIGDWADVLIHECSVLDSSEHEKGHTTPTALGEFLKDVPVERLVLTHFSSEISGNEKEIVEIIKRYFSGDVVVGEDLLSLDVP